MPAILKLEAIDVWLDLDPLPPEVAVSMLQPFDESLMTARDVSKRVNSANYDAPDVLEPDPTLF
jgi:putative SOS response-associated peptidase YedK